MVVLLAGATNDGPVLIFFDRYSFL